MTQPWGRERSELAIWGALGILEVCPHSWRSRLETGSLRDLPLTYLMTVLSVKSLREAPLTPDPDSPSPPDALTDGPSLAFLGSKGMALTSFIPGPSSGKILSSGQAENVPG